MGSIPLLVWSLLPEWYKGLGALQQLTEGVGWEIGEPWAFQGWKGWWICWKSFELLLSFASQKNPVIGRSKSKYLAYLRQGSAWFDESAVMIGLIPAKGLIWLTTACAHENEKNLCQLILQKQGKVMFFVELFWEWLIIPSTRTPWCARQV